MTLRKQPKTPKAVREMQISDAIEQVAAEGIRLTFVEVASRVGVSTTLIQLKHPIQAQRIRNLAGIVQDDGKSRLRDEIARLGEVNSRLNAEVTELKRDLAKQASINEALRRQRVVDNAVLSGKVVRLQAPSSTRDN